MIFLLLHTLYLIGKFITRKFRFSQSNALETLSITNNMSENNTDQNDSLMSVDDVEENETNMRFSPPVYIQRYVAVQNVLSNERYKGKIRKVVEFGCAELKFVTYLKHTEGVEEIVCVDIDRGILEYNKHKIEPLNVDYLRKRNIPLKMGIYEGSVTENDKVLENTDAVICIELIEHLYSDTLKGVPQNIFGFMKPLVVIMTTPNQEFNVLFKLTGFRHYDHKFEWTRKEFEDWAHEITARYSDYEVTFEGVGDAPENMKHLGCCSQMAIFHRTRDTRRLRTEGIPDLYKLVHMQEYPYKIDKRSDDQKILDDVEYYIRHFSSGDSAEEISLDLIRKSVTSFTLSEETLIEVLVNNGWTIIDREEGKMVVVPEPSISSSVESAELDEYDLFDNRSIAEDGWDYEPGPPSSYTEDYIQERFFSNEDVSRENWDDQYVEDSEIISATLEEVNSDVLNEQDASNQNSELSRDEYSTSSNVRENNASSNLLNFNTSWVGEIRVGSGRTVCVMRSVNNSDEQEFKTRQNNSETSEEDSRDAASGTDAMNETSELSHGESSSDLSESNLSLNPLHINTNYTNEIQSEQCIMERNLDINNKKKQEIKYLPNASGTSDEEGTTDAVHQISEMPQSESYINVNLAQNLKRNCTGENQPKDFHERSRDENELEISAVSSNECEASRVSKKPRLEEPK